MSSKQKESSAESLPLMDELNELIEKERTLLNLKLLAQKNETETWKTKYDKLIDKVGSGNVNIDLTTEQQLEAAAEVDSEHIENNASYADIQKILIERISSWALDLSRTKMNLLDFSKLCKEVFGSRSSFDSINLVDLHNCGLTDEYTTPLLSFIRSSRLQAIDLSSNELSEIFFLQLLTTLKDRRSTPQYILLSNNVPLSTTTKHLAAILDTLTEHTWGLTVSLQDFTDIALSSLPMKGNKRSAVRKELNYDYKETIKQPNFAFEFLRAYNTKLDPAGKGLDGAGDKTTTITASALKKAAAAGRGAVVLGRQKGLHKLAAFGLTHCKLSTRSIALLETTLLHTAPTLTDLDLSFAYIGYPGAEVLKRVLSSPGCQLVRLAVVGNALGDAGIAAVSKSLKAHPTLTYLDVRSNAITDLGMSALTLPLLSNHVLSVLDLRGNCFSQEALLVLKTSLYNVGSQIQLRWADVASTADVMVPSVRALEQNVVFSAPHKVKVVGVVGSPTKLFSIDLAAIQQHHPEQCEFPLCLHWQWRPVPIGTHSTAGALLTMPSADGAADARQKAPSRSSQNHHSSTTAAAGNDNAAFFHIGSAYTAHWEVRLVHNNQEIFCQNEAVTATSSITRSLLQRDPQWTACSVLLPKLHGKATLEVYVRCADGGTGSLRDTPNTTTQHSKAAKKFIAFEGLSFQLRSMQASSAYAVGGDSAELSVPGSSLFAQYGVNMLGLQRLYPEMSGLSLLRRFCWTQTAVDTVELAWKAKLTSSLTAEKEPVAGASHKEGEFTPGHRSLGYTWVVFVYSADGGVRRAAEGICTASSLEEISSSDRNSGSSGNAKLRAWQWNDCNTTVSNLRLGDTLLLTARVHSEQSSYPAAALQNCSVTVRDCSLSVLGDASPSQPSQYEGVDETIGRSAVPAGVLWDVDRASLLAVHDDAHVYLPM